MSSTEVHYTESDRKKRTIGLGLYLFGQIVGGGLLFFMLIVAPLVTGRFDLFMWMCLAACLALPAGAVYLTVPRLLDRYDPEPWYLLIGCLLWGGLAACGFSATANDTFMAIAKSVTDPETAESLTAVISAPIFEEFFKGLAIFGLFMFVRRDFDGVVDGIIYATFTALGFATIENVLYYMRAAEAGGAALSVTFVMRGVIAPWGHPVYTSMLGIGFGMARETTKTWVKFAAPLAGYMGAVTLHALWNGTATLAGASQEGGALFICSLPLWFALVFTFVVAVIVLVRRRGKIIRSYLVDEVALGNMTDVEVDFVCDAFGLVRARMKYGKPGVEFVRAAARLGLTKWHAQRAAGGGMQTVSFDFVVPLRKRMKELRAQLASRQT